MRKIGVICMVLIFAASNVLAQDIQEKKKAGRGAEKDFSEILPHAEDLAIGLDMARLTQSILNSITNAGAKHPIWAFQSDFYGKYFPVDNGALRVRFGVGSENHTDKNFVRDDVANLTNPLGNNPLDETKTVDVWKHRLTNLELGIGYEFRRTLWRVQGYAGGEAFGGVGFGRDFYEYGNPITATNQTPTTYYKLNPLNTGSYRALDGKTFGFTAGVRGIIGADLFICRNLSIGAEFHLEGRWWRFNERKMTTETWKVDQVYVKEEPIKPVHSSFDVNPGWGLNLMIYF